MAVGRWVRRALLGFVVLAVIAVLAAWGVSRSSWGREELRQFVESQAASVLNGTLTIERVSGSIINGITLNGVRFTHDAREVFAAKSVTVGYSVWGLVRGLRTLGAIRVVDPVIRLTESHNNWDAAQWVRSRPKTTTVAKTSAFLLPSIEIVNGRLLTTARESTWRIPAELRELNGDVTVRIGGGTRIEINRLAFVAVPEATGAFRAQKTSGAITFAEDTLIEQLRLESDAGTLVVNGRVGPGSPHPLDLRASLESFNAARWRPWTPLLDTVDLTATGTATFGGNVDQLTIRARLDTSAGTLETTTLIASKPGETRITGDGQLAKFDAQQVTASPNWASAITGRTEYVVVGTGTPTVWTADVKLRGGPMRAFDVLADQFDGTIRYADNIVNFAGAVRAYGAAGRATGVVTIADQITIDVTGTDLINVDPRALPADWGMTPLEARFNASAFTARWTPGRWSADVTLAESTVEGATVASGTTVQLTSAPGAVTLASDGNVRSLDARRLGRATGLTGVDDPLFVTDLNGHVRMTGQGADWSNLDLVGRAELTNSQAAVGATVPSATVAYTRVGHLNTAKVTGIVAGLHPERLGASEALASTINGALDFTAIWHDDAEDIPGTMTASGTLRATPSVLARLPIDRGVVTGEWRDGMFTAQSATFEGGGVTMTGRGRIAVTAGTSRATFEVVAADIFALEPWSGQVAHGPISATGELLGTFEMPHVRATFESAIAEPDLGTPEQLADTISSS
jgi:hypothetical protein